MVAITDSPGCAASTSKIGKVRLVLFLLLILSLAAVKAIDADCRNEYLAADDGVTRLTTDGGKLLSTGKVWLRIGTVGVLLPEGVHSILFKLGLMLTECK